MKFEEILPDPRELVRELTGWELEALAVSYLGLEDPTQVTVQQAKELRAVIDKADELRGLRNKKGAWK